MTQPNPLTDSRRAYLFLKQFLNSPQEEFWAVALNSELRPLKAEMIFRGTVNSCPTHPREIVRFLVLNSASSFLIAHNHPTGLSLPSRSDLAVTRQIWKVSRLMQIPLNDHLILGTDGYSSLADRGFFRTMSRKI